MPIQWMAPLELRLTGCISAERNLEPSSGPLILEEHASVQTTARYDRWPEEAKQRVAGSLHVPYNRRER